MTTNSTPLLHPQNSPIQSTVESPTGAVHRSSNSIQQLFQSIFVAAAWFFDGQQTFITVFTDADPDWNCLDPLDQVCNSASSPCGLQPGSWAWASTIPTSIVSNWGLQCANKIVLSLPASAFFIGCVVGALLSSTLSDSFLGRKMLLIISCLIMSFGGVMAVFSPNIWVYSGFKFVSGLGRASVGSSALVLSMEIADKWWRDKIGVLGFGFYMLGFLTLPIMAYGATVRGLSWKSMYLLTNIPSFCYAILLYFCVQESPRWLKTHRRIENIVTQSQQDEPELKYTSYDFISSLKIICSTKHVLWKLMAVMMASFGTGFVYFGLPFTLQTLNLDLYLSSALNALSELPACILTLLLITTASRRVSVLVLTTISGLCSLLCAFKTVGVASGIQLTAEVVSYCAACTAINVMLIYCVELFPTTVRNTAVSLVRETTLLAGAFGPVMAAEGKSSGRWRSFGLFGLAIGLFSVPLAFLPETKGRDLVDDIQDA